MVQLVSVIVPPLLNTPPPLPLVALPPVMVSSERDAVTFGSTRNTRESPPPLTVTPPAGPAIVAIPPVLLSSSGAPTRVIVWGVEKTAGSQEIAWSGNALRLAIASRRVVLPSPGSESSDVVSTTKLGV